MMFVSAVTLRQKLMYDIFYRRALNATYGCGRWGIRFHAMYALAAVPWLAVCPLPQFEGQWWTLAKHFVFIMPLTMQVCSPVSFLPLATSPCLSLLPFTLSS